MVNVINERDTQRVMLVIGMRSQSTIQRRTNREKVLMMIGTMGEMLNKFFSSVFTRSDNSDRVDLSPGVRDDHVNTGDRE